MKHISQSRRRVPARAGFTLIELLVVMTIIFALVSLVFPVAGALKKKRLIAVAQAELKQMETAIEAYKSRTGFYPPDNPTNSLINQLYFELSGTVMTNIDSQDYFVTRDGSSQILRSDLPALFNISGFANSSQTKLGTDDRAAAVNFLASGLKPTQIGLMSVNTHPPVKALLVCSVLYPADPPLVWWRDNTVNPHTVASGLNPWRYASSNPVNNPGSYDLWVDFPVGSRLYRVSNWSKEPQIIN
jgi:prepilin-type N-terminal cleavage/methylation domain-containing protein